MYFFDVSQTFKLTVEHCVVLCVYTFVRFSVYLLYIGFTITVK